MMHGRKNIKNVKKRVKNQLFSCKNLDKQRETRAVRCEDSINKELLKEQNGF